MQRAILVVESDPDQRASLRAKLAGNGNRVVGEASSADEAMRLAVMRGPDAAVVATELARGDGIHLASRLGTEHGIPTVLLAPLVALPDIARAVQAGVMGFLVKPVDPSALGGMLEIAVCRFQEILSLRREAETLRRMLESRKVIERAKGLLMQMQGLSEQEAFARLRQRSMDTQRPMADIARAILLAMENQRANSIGNPLPGDPGRGRAIRHGRQDTIGVRMHRQNKEADAFTRSTPGRLRDQEPDCSMKR